MKDLIKGFLCGFLCALILVFLIVQIIVSIIEYEHKCNCLRNTKKHVINNAQFVDETIHTSTAPCSNNCSRILNRDL